MPLVLTPAIVLHAFKYGESSKIVRLLTPERGVLSAIAKGALNPRSRFGARLQVLSDGIAQLYVKPTRDLQTLAAFDLTAQRPGLALDVRRYATGVAVAELMLRFTPAEPHPGAFALVAGLLDEVAEIEPARLEAKAIAAVWQVVAALGFGPSLDRCARGGCALPAGAVRFSVADGGFLCARCMPDTTGAARRLESADRETLTWLAQGAPAPPEDGRWRLPARRGTAHRRLVARFVARHLADGERPDGTPLLHALTFWETLPWTVTS